MNLITLEIFHQKHRVNINRLLLNRDPKNYRNKNSLALNAKQAKFVRNMKGTVSSICR